MITAIFKNSLFVLLILSLLFFIPAQFFRMPAPVLRTDYIAPPTVITSLAIGLKVQVADSFWLRAIQDFEYCSQPINDRECRGKSWLFLIMDLITDMDPKFFYAFYSGSLALTVVISDYEGASRIFDKGIPLFPKKWTFQYAAGYHAYFEEKDKIKASHLFYMASENGAPDWLKVTAGRLAKEGGDLDASEKILQQMIATSEDPKLVERLKEKLRDLKKSQ